MKLSADDMREFYQSRKLYNSEELKEALTIKDLGVFSRRKQGNNSRLCLFKKSDSSDAIKKIYIR